MRFILNTTGPGEYFHLCGDNYPGTGLKFDPFSKNFSQKNMNFKQKFLKI